MNLIRVAPQVEQLAIFRIEEMHELPISRPNHRLEIVGGEVHVPGGLAEHLLPAVPWLFLESVNDRFGFHLARRLEGGQLEDGRPDVEQGAQAVQFAPSGEPARRPHNQRHARDRVIHRPFLAVTVVGQAIPVVRREDDDGIFEIAGFI